MPAEKEVALTGLKVLLVRNEDGIWDALFSTLLSCNCFLLSVNLVKDGMRLLALDRFDVVVSDDRLDEANGFEFFQRVAPLCRNTRKILIADQTMAARKFQSPPGSVDQILSKPLRMNYLLKSLSEIKSNNSATRRNCSARGS